MSEFKKVECTCSHGYACRNMQDPNCCAHNCDYNDLVDALNALKAERDAALAQNKRMKTFIRMTSEKFEGDNHVEPSMLTLMRVAKEVPDDVLAAHDAEVAKAAYLACLAQCEQYFDSYYAGMVTEADAELYTASLNK